MWWPSPRSFDQALALGRRIQRVVVLPLLKHAGGDPVRAPHRTGLLSVTSKTKLGATTSSVLLSLIEIVLDP